MSVLSLEEKRGYLTRSRLRSSVKFFQTWIEQQLRVRLKKGPKYGILPRSQVALLKS